MKPLNSHSQTLPSSPIHHHHHHSSSSDFEFTAALSPRKSTAANLRPADELFYNGRLLPLHLSSSNSMASTTLLLTTTTTTTTTGRHSSDYHSSFSYDHNQKLICNQEKKLLIGGKTFSFPRFSSVFRKETKSTEADHPSTITAKSMSATAKEKIRKYLKKVKPLYEKLSQQHKTTTPLPSLAKREDVVISQPFPGFLRRTSCVSSCPSTMPSSPTHSGVLCRKTIVRGTTGGYVSNHSSSTEELQSAIQGAIAHCKSSMATQAGWKNK